ncbi:TetR/AcrR family transcriptional regulator [Paenibacillus sp. NFR01]|uniref:TetR/AcrR family transcriptional regulator n=1 Tax=Paenibacillus sp. NFR01 TaxID=1566279 RepID=UPI0008B90319|nr:TetR/AcrR family transcriptional regulator [Paenibacillus sp. NFR01]SET03097.1 transcriptional regulator, TetR family [Paenibacillus sp. NFR01]
MSQNGDTPEHGGDTPRRRRGKALEEAILQAAWAELNETGYNKLTMEGVAARAETNKAVLYRRWPSKAKLVVSSISANVTGPTLAPPRTGSLRNDMLALLSSIVQPMQEIGAQTLHGLLTDLFDSELIASIPQMMNSGEDDKMTLTIREILREAEQRGELKVSLNALSPRIITLPMQLLRIEILMTHEPMSDETILEIIDEIFMPLVAKAAE